MPSNLLCSKTEKTARIFSDATIVKPWKKLCASSSSSRSTDEASVRCELYGDAVDAVCSSWVEQDRNFNRCIVTIAI